MKQRIFIFKLHFLRLPSDIHKSIVLLLDVTIATGAAAIMAIRVLLDHHVEEQNIIIVSLITTVQGDYY
jgi:uridine kinase